MQPLNLQLPQITLNTYFNYLGQQIWQDYSWQILADHKFEFSGFGDGDKKRKIAPTAGEYIKTYDKFLTGRVDRREYYWTGDYQGGTSHEGPITPWVGLQCVAYKSSYDDRAYNKALDKFYDQLRATEANLALTLGEGKESVHMLKAFSSMSKIITLARQAKRKLLQNPSLLMSEIWLSMQLAWKPLYQDVYTWLHFTYKSFDEGVPVKARSRIKGDVYDRIEANVINSTPFVTGHRVISGKRNWSAEIKVWAGIDDNDAYNHSQITSLNPLSIAWELVPLSFFVDYFYNIGGYLQNMEAYLGTGLSFKRGYVTEMYFHDLKESVGQLDPWNSNYNGNSYYQAYHVFGEGGSYYVRKRRYVLPWFPFPRAPTFKVSLGWQRLLTSTALLRTILLGGVKGRRV